MLLPEEVEGGGDFYLSAVVEDVQGDQEQVEYTRHRHSKWIGAYVSIPIDVVNILVVADDDVEDDDDGVGGEHDGEEDCFIQVVELDKGR